MLETSSNTATTDNNNKQTEAKTAEFVIQILEDLLMTIGNVNGHRACCIPRWASYGSWPTTNVI